MKYYFISIICITLSSISFAQIQKGTVLTGAQTSFDSKKESLEFATTDNFEIGLGDFKTQFIATQPQIGFFISENLLVGVGIRYEFESSERPSERPIFGTINATYGIDQLEQRSNLFLINPHISRYNKITENLYFTTTLNLLAGLGNGDYGEFEEQYEFDTDLTELRINLTPGLTYFFSRKWALRLEVGQLFYNWKREKFSTDIGSGETVENIDSDYGMSFDFRTINIGFQFILSNGSN